MDLEWVRSVLEASYIVKVRGIMGPEEKDKKYREILERAVEAWILPSIAPSLRVRLSQLRDRPDFRYSVRELNRDTSRPVQRIKKLVRFLRGHPRSVQMLQRSLTRKSTNGGCLMRF